jgi:AcrR family transcriptional regulator
MTGEGRGAGEASFQRARKPEQVAARRQAILLAAAELFDAEGPDGAGLTAIAARAGFTKSNVYRYFESREAVLLDLFVASYGAAVDELEAELGDVRRGDTAAVARVLAGVFLRHPRLCHLLSILGTVLETNVTEAVLIEVKRAIRKLS